MGADHGKKDGCAPDYCGLSGGNEMKTVVLAVVFCSTLSFVVGVVNGTIAANKIRAVKECGK